MRHLWRPDDRASSRYHYVPIPGSEFRVELDYDRSAGVIDLGLFDAAGRFHGYSGGARDSFTVTSDWATPGYLPGPVDGAVLFLGLHRIPPSGLLCSLSVGAPVVEPTPPAPPVPPRPPRRADVPEGWHVGDLHAHTVHSDGVLTVDELAALAVSAGLDFLAVTDHNTVSHHALLGPASRRYGVTLIPGQEVTTDLGHANAFGDIGWVDFRRPPDMWAPTGLLSINHPLAADYAWRHPLRTRPALAEIWHSGWWDRTWSAPLAWLLAWSRDTVPIGGSDFHRPSDDRLGHPTTWVRAESPSGPDILAGLEAGRTAISESPDGPLLLRSDDGLLALGADGLLLTDFTGQRRPVRGDRFEARAPDGVAWLEDHRTQVMAIG
ncbi:CehA/McbA family metallohydrolase [Allorhizocola rhizosphaerae]|uniref:CehA/McbA family metallohydrolase n=1 Tax=Allorhizocola rhizosphaerae TaxID=1872709 RepID=UPI000E3CC835|nr:CehA/McbA family metallohydrolase [Allorhizocola rhizosphaerae]